MLDCGSKRDNSDSSVLIESIDFCFDFQEIDALLNVITIPDVEGMPSGWLPKLESE